MLLMAIFAIQIMQAIALAKIAEHYEKKKKQSKPAADKRRFGFKLNLRRKKNNKTEDQSGEAPPLFF
jgi:hypothetical protein